MELLNKERLQQMIKLHEVEGDQLPAMVRQVNIRLETKLAYGAVMLTLMDKAAYTKDNIAYIKADNPEMRKTLATLANKDVDQDKMNQYIKELEDANLIVVEKQNVSVYDVE